MRSRAYPWWGRRRALPAELFGPEIKRVRWEGKTYRWGLRMRCLVVG